MITKEKTRQMIIIYTWKKNLRKILFEFDNEHYDL